MNAAAEEVLRSLLANAEAGFGLAAQVGNIVNQHSDCTLKDDLELTAGNLIFTNSSVPANQIGVSRLNFFGTWSVTDGSVEYIGGAPASGIAQGLTLAAGPNVKLGFFNVPEIARPAGYTLTFNYVARTDVQDVPSTAVAVMTSDITGTADSSLSAVGDTSTGDRSPAIKDNFYEFFTAYNAAFADMRNLSLVLAQVLNDLDEYGLALFSYTDSRAR